MTERMCEPSRRAGVTPASEDSAARPWIATSMLRLCTMVACPQDRLPDAVRLGEVGPGPQRAEPLDGLSKVQKSRASCHERVGHDRTKIGMLGRLEDPVGDLDRSVVVFVHEVGTGELAEQQDACRIGHEIGELGRGGFEEGERVRGPVPVQEYPAKGCGSAGDGGAVIERALRGDRPPEMRLGGLVLARPKAVPPARSRRSAVSAGSLVTASAWSRNTRA